MSSSTSVSLPITDQIAALISAISSEDFYPQLATFLRQRVQSDSIVILTYHLQQTPVVLFEDLAPLDRQALYGSYFEGGYLLSPFYLQWLENKSSLALSRLKEIAPEGFFDSIYFTDYYGRSGLRDEMGYLIPLNLQSAVLISLGRTDQLKAYTAPQQKKLASVLSIVASCIQLHASMFNEPSRPSIKKQLSDTFLSFGSDILTTQERRVVQLMLRGHSSKSCARELGISPTTERVHRRNIYAKLNISSQAELFILLFDSFASIDQPTET